MPVYRVWLSDGNYKVIEADTPKDAESEAHAILTVEKGGASEPTLAESGVKVVGVELDVEE